MSDTVLHLMKYREPPSARGEKRAWHRTRCEIFITHPNWTTDPSLANCETCLAALADDSAWLLSSATDTNETEFDL